MAALSPNSLAVLREMVGEGGIGPVRWAGREILQRIFVSVRDRNWQEIAPTQWETHFDEARNRVTIEARHTSDLVDFRWNGILQLENDPHGLSFEFGGEALRDMQICRLGLIVLHPVAAMVGATVAARGPSGEERFEIEASIHPQPVIEGMPQAIAEPFEGLEISRPDLGVLRLAFGGDLFELEDQRNWGDASFKTYCTPLRLGFPRQVAKGTRIAHRMRATYSPSQGQAAALRVPVEARDPTVATFPLLGRVGFDAGRRRWRHIQIDLPTLRDRLAGSNEPTEVPLELSIDPTDRSALESIDELQRRGATLARVLVKGAGTDLPSAGTVAAAREGLAAFPSAAILSATTGYFVEHNRGLPLQGAVHGIAFPLTPTVHSADAPTIRANVPTIADIVRTAQALHAPQAIAIAPLALYFPARAHPAFPPGLAAPWLVATLMQAGLAGVTSATLGDDVRIAIGDGPLLDALLRYSGSEIKPSVLPLEQDVYALEFVNRTGGRSLLIANLRDESVVLPAAFKVRAIRNLLTGTVVSDGRGSRAPIPALAVLELEIG